MDKTLVGLMMIFFLAFTVFITFVIFNEQLSTITRASTEEVNVEKSLIFVWPLTVPADGKTPSEVQVFVRTEEGRAIEGKTVVLETSMGLVDQESAVTDKSGKATFTVVATTPGLADIQALVDNVTINKNVSIKFE